MVFATCRGYMFLARWESRSEYSEPLPMYRERHEVIIDQDDLTDQDRQETQTPPPVYIP